MNSSTWQVSTIAGPAIGGLVYLAGPDVVYGTVAGLLAAAFVLIVGVKTGKARAPGDARQLAHAARGSALRLDARK